MDEVILVKGKYEQATLECIKDTVRVMEKCIKECAPKKPTCNQELYVRDIKFLLNMIERGKS